MIPLDVEKEIAEYLTRLAAIMSGEAEICPSCEGKVEKLEKIGRCVYALPCHHRIYQGEIPEPWKEDKPKDEGEKTE